MTGASDPSRELTGHPSGHGFPMSVPGRSQALMPEPFKGKGTPGVRGIVDRAGLTRRRSGRGSLGAITLAVVGGLALGGLVNQVHAAPLPSGVFTVTDDAQARAVPSSKIARPLAPRCGMPV